MAALRKSRGNATSHKIRMGDIFHIPSRAGSIKREEWKLHEVAGGEREKGERKNPQDPGNEVNLNSLGLL